MRPEYRAFLVGLVGAFLATIPGVSWLASLILFATAATIAALMRGDRVGFAAAWLGALVRILTIVIPLAGNPEYGFEGAVYIGLELGIITGVVLGATFLVVGAIRQRL